MRKLKIQRKLKNFNSNVKTKINNEIKRKGKKGFIWEIIFSFLIFCASAVLIFVLYIIISAPNFEKDKLQGKVSQSCLLDRLYTGSPCLCIFNNSEFYGYCSVYQ